MEVPSVCLHQVWFHQVQPIQEAVSQVVMMGPASIILLKGKEEQRRTGNAEERRM